MKPELSKDDASAFRNTPEPDKGLVCCPFCAEDGYDLIGLKWHLSGRCDAFNATKSPFEDCGM